MGDWRTGPRARCQPLRFYCTSVVGGWAFGSLSGRKHLCLPGFHGNGPSRRPGIQLRGGVHHSDRRAQCSARRQYLLLDEYPADQRGDRHRIQQADRPRDRAVILNFTTGPGALLSRLAVTGFNPPFGYPNAGTNTAVTVAVNQRLNPLTVSTSSVTMYGYLGNTNVAGTISLAADGKSLTFTPSAALQDETLYEWTVTGIQDQEGNGAGQNGSFTTGLTAYHASPTITAVNPPNGSQNIAINVIPGFLVIEPVDILSVSNNSITLMAGNAAVAGTVTLQPDLQTILFQPAGLLSPGTTYTATVTGIADIEGNVIAPFTSSFTTSTAVTPDTTPPTVLTSNPADGSTNVPTNSPVVLTFSKNIDPLSANLATVSITLQPNGNQIAGAYSVDNSTANGTITFTPSPASPFPPSGVISVYVNGVQDYSGNAAAGFGFSFGTAAGADSIPPTVTSVTPPNLSTGVGQSSPITLTFSKSLDPTTLTATSLALFEGNILFNLNNGYRNYINYSQDGTSVTLGPLQLPGSTTVTVVATHDITDLAQSAGSPAALDAMVTLACHDLSLRRFLALIRSRFRPLIAASQESSHSTRLPKHVLHSLRMLGDDRQQHPGGRVRARPALFPVAQRGRRETELRRELSLTQPHFRPNLTHVNLRHMHQRDADVVVLAVGPRDGLLQSFDDARADGRPLLRDARRLLHHPLRFRLRNHSRLLFPRSIPSHQDRHQTLHGATFRPAQVRLLVLRIGCQQEHRQAFAVVVVDHSRTAPLALSGQRPPDLSHPAGLRDHLTRLGVRSDEGYQFGALGIG
jgi:hypothetical protein